MKITVIIDYEGGKEHVAVQERHFDKELAEDLNGGIRWIGEVIRNGIVGYLSACEEWTMKSEVEKMLLCTVKLGQTHIYLSKTRKVLVHSFCFLIPSQELVNPFPYNL